MKNSAHTAGEELRGILAFIGVIWVVFILDWVVYPIDFRAFGLVPRTLTGTVGIVSMPFLHGDWGHLIGNTVPLFVLLVLLAGSRARSWAIVGEIIVAGGALLWVFGREVNHIGASGLVFGLVAFLILAGVLERRIIPLFVSFAVGILYGGTLFWGMLPTAGSDVSWDGHLCGAVAGGMAAWFLVRQTGPREPAGA